MFYYDISLRGTSHIKSDKPNQDYALCIDESNYLIGAIADGVGSSKHSDIASKTAVEISIKYCKEHISSKNIGNIEEIQEVIKSAYAHAQNTIEEIAITNSNEFFDYDTTLSLVIYDGKNIIYGHSGDGGIVLLTRKGDYVKLTNPQKTSDGVCVIPLRAGSKDWEFGFYTDEEVVSVLLATDGIYDIFFPYLLRGEETEVYVPLIRYFMDNNVIGVNKKNIKEVKEQRISFLESDACKGITDDKSVLVMINNKINVDFKEETFYAEPNWNELQEKWNKKAYPHLYKNENSEK